MIMTGPDSSFLKKSPNRGRNICRTIIKKSSCYLKRSHFINIEATTHVEVEGSLMLDMSAYNAFLLFTEVGTSSNPSGLQKRRNFLKALREAVLKPYVEHRKHTPRAEAAKQVVAKVQLQQDYPNKDSQLLQVQKKEDNVIFVQKLTRVPFHVKGARITASNDMYFSYARTVFSNMGFRVVQIEECWHKSLTPLMNEIRKQIDDSPVYVSLDIDALDPAYAPGTGTPEIAGLTPIQMLEIVRGCNGLNIVGGDLVEVSPPYDPSGNTALTAAGLLFELLCVLPGSSNNK